jgi:adenine-specific DNA glycosylase
MSKSSQKNKIAVKRGRPNTEEGIAKVTENLKPRLKHGLYYLRTHNRLSPSCSSCPFRSGCEYGDKENDVCHPIVKYEEEIINELFALSHIKPEQDKYLVYLFAEVQVRIWVMNKWLNEISGSFRISNDAIDVQPLMEQRAKEERTLIKLADKLFLSPEARSKLGVAMATYSLARSLMNVNVQENDDY